MKTKTEASFAPTFSSFAVKFFFTLFFSFFVFNLSAQDEKVSDIISSIAEELADDESDPEAVSAFIDKLQELNEKPVRINSADEPELSRLFFLTDFQVKALLDYVHSTGRIVSIYEIANIAGFNRELVSMMTPFISLNSEMTNHPDSVRFRNSFLSNFSARYPVSDASAPGSVWKVLARYRFTAGKFSGGFTSEKDAGEKLLSGNPPLPDFLSANLAWSGKGIVRKLIAGDFGARFGMGTNINTGLRTGLSLTQSGYLTGRDEIKPYTSADENIFFRGAAAQLQLKRTGLSLFFSRNRIDATIDTTDDKTDLFIKAFYKSGLHNSFSSVIKKDAVTEYCYGVNLSSDFNNISIGLLWSASRFNLPVERIDPDPENIYDFRGNKSLTASAYYKALLGKMVLYGELSSNLNGRIAFIQGLIFRPADRLAINILYRNYHPGFTGFHGKGIFSSSAGDNVKGIFGNFTFEAARHLFISGGCDLRYYPWLKYRCSAPSMGVSRELRIKLLPSDKITIETAYNYRMAALNSQDTYGIEKQENLTSRSVKGVIRYSPVDNLTFVTRMDYKVTQPGRNTGTLLLQDLNFRFRKDVSIWFRYCIFKTDNWDSRLYTYENDLLYNFSIPALSGEGSRSYIMIAWEAARFADVRLKYAFTGLMQNRNYSTETKELKVQVRMWF